MSYQRHGFVFCFNAPLLRITAECNEAVILTLDQKRCQDPCPSPSEPAKDADRFLERKKRIPVTTATGIGLGLYDPLKRITAERSEAVILTPAPKRCQDPRPSPSDPDKDADRFPEKKRSQPAAGTLKRGYLLFNSERG